MLEKVLRRRITLPHTGRVTALLDWGGAGPLALLHHANGFCAALWDGVAQQLRADFHVVAVDARGHGDSARPPDGDDFSWSDMADDLVAVAEQLLADSGQRSVALGLGHSFGGTLTLAAAGRRPGLYERALLVDPVILPPMTFEAAMKRAAENGLAERSRKRRHVWKDRADARAFFAEKELFAQWQDAALDLYVAEGLRERSEGQVELKCPGEVEAAIFERAHTLDIFAAASAVDIPVRLLWAANGDFPRVIYEQLVAQMDEGSVADVAGGHLVPMEAPTHIAEAVVRFVSETS
jgi:pimeloyl-ACP methyl ester carboxylesterase